MKNLTVDKIAQLTKQLSIETQRYIDAVAANHTHLFGEIRSNITLLQDEIEKLQLQQIKERNG